MLQLKLEMILICNCNEIYKCEIVKAIKEKGLKTVKEIEKKPQQVLFVDNVWMIYKKSLMS